jgi:hypothetical protein
MAKNQAAFAVHDRVIHSVYGLGTIREAGDRHTTIAFDENGTRKFMTDMVRLEHSATPAPAKPVRPSRAKKAKT